MIGTDHETFLVEQDVSAVPPGNMPGFRYRGKAAYVPVIRQKETAGRRLGRDTAPAVPLPTHPS
ncbi:hypothetical protein [Paenibacillus sp. SSG-1]|uniref:hypothetical protein n=1 Tax=Paenibacillus sp. SSG-1 TaxID=1443669 RepID=UPI001C52FEF6|nr:hypothetical protein [Paenibacillus sp. SSG-1]